MGSVKAVCLKRAQADLAYPRFTSFVHIFRAGNWIFLAAGYDREIQGCLGKLYVVGAEGGTPKSPGRGIVWSVPSADTSPGESALVFISPVPI